MRHAPVHCVVVLYTMCQSCVPPSEPEVLWWTASSNQVSGPAISVHCVPASRAVAPELQARVQLYRVFILGHRHALVEGLPPPPDPPSDCDRERANVLGKAAERHIRSTFLTRIFTTISGTQ